MTALRPFLALWLPVPVFVADGYLLARADLLVQEGVPDLDPLAGLSTMFIIALVAAGAVVALVLSVVGTFARRSRSGITLGNAIWTAATLVPFTVFLAVVTYLEPTYDGSTTLGGQLPLQLGAAVLAVVPLAVHLGLRRSDRHGDPVAHPAAREVDRAGSVDRVDGVRDAR